MKEQLNAYRTSEHFLRELTAAIKSGALFSLPATRNLETQADRLLELAPINPTGIT